MRRRSKSKLLIDKADRALQDFYRRIYPKRRCESCGGLFGLIHHFIEKSKSNYLRFHKKNLIFICKKCHSLHHCFGDSKIHAKIILKRGQKWLREIIKLNKIKKQSYNVKELEELIKKYE